MVERYLTGKDYRILVVDKRVVAVAERVPAHVVGDGVSTVGELVDIANADPAARHWARESAHPDPAQ